LWRSPVRGGYLKAGTSGGKNTVGRSEGNISPQHKFVIPMTRKGKTKEPNISEKEKRGGDANAGREGEETLRKQ